MQEPCVFRVAFFRFPRSFTGVLKGVPSGIFPLQALGDRQLGSAGVLLGDAGLLPCLGGWKREETTKPPMTIVLIKKCRNPT